jgi:pantoate--beta-alanine ligase
VVCPIVREADGLAMSSRNAYLQPDERRAATILFRALDGARASIARGERDALRLTAVMLDALRTERLAESDYVELVDADTLEPVTRLRGVCLALLAVRIGAVRLIDNLRIEEREGMFQTTL